VSGPLDTLKMRKLHISPTEREILSVLSEAGEENLPALLNTIYMKFPALSRQEMLMAGEKGLRNLHSKGFIEFCVETQNRGRVLTPLSAHETKKALSLAKVLVWNDKNKMWDWDVEKNGEWVVVTLTDKGQEALLR
jgi:hypothetical protein